MAKSGAPAAPALGLGPVLRSEFRELQAFALYECQDCGRQIETAAGMFPLMEHLVVHMKLEKAVLRRAARCLAVAA